jgi:hypothetical protein
MTTYRLFPISGSIKYDEQKKSAICVFKSNNYLLKKDGTREKIEFFKKMKANFNDHGTILTNVDCYYAVMNVCHVLTKIDENRTLNTSILIFDVKFCFTNLKVAGIGTNKTFHKYIISTRGKQLRKDLIKRVSCLPKNYNFIDFEKDKNDAIGNSILLFIDKIYENESKDIQYNTPKLIYSNSFYFNEDKKIQTKYFDDNSKNLELDKISQEDYIKILLNTCILDDSDKFNILIKDSRFHLNEIFKNENYNLLHLCAKYNSIKISNILIKNGNIFIFNNYFFII